MQAVLWASIELSAATAHRGAAPPVPRGPTRRVPAPKPALIVQRARQASICTSVVGAWQEAVQNVQTVQQVSIGTRVGGPHQGAVWLV